MRDLTIVSETGKGRSFRGSLLTYTTCTPLFSSPNADTIRPIFAMVATSQAESIPFIRNLQSGRKALMFDGRDKKTFECLKSADYEYKPFVCPEGVVWTVYLPQFYRIDPGMVDPERVEFCTPGHWLAEADEGVALELLGMYPIYDDHYQRAERTAERLAVCRYITRIAARFCERLDPRTRCPLIPDRRFYSLVLAALLDSGQATFAGASHSREGAHGRFNYDEVDLGDVGLEKGIACATSHVMLEPVLAECVRVYESRHTLRQAA